RRAIDTITLVLQTPNYKSQLCPVGRVATETSKKRHLHLHWGIGQHRSPPTAKLVRTSQQTQSRQSE
uniref:Uncharacterized protein n=1 Tax=Oryza brachyantha TaxID=4533 RepID=J3MRY7_ORYBR